MQSKYETHRDAQWIVNTMCETMGEKRAERCGRHSGQSSRHKGEISNKKYREILTEQKNEILCVTFTYTEWGVKLTPFYMMVAQLKKS
jgi:hypothetical protein